MLFSCNKNPVNILNKDVLASQIFSVNVNRDTTLLTKNGCVVNIKKNALESDSATVKIEIIEALSNTDIVLAGLTTMSGKQALSSGGMLYVNAAIGYKVTIKKELEILVPTKNYVADMSVYKGEEKDGKIDWTNPDPLPNDTLQRNIKIGEQLFKANCTNCHKVNDDYSAPAMYGIPKRRSRQWIYDFIHNPAGMIYSEKHARASFDEWKPTIMTAYLNLTNKDIDAILAYTESKGNANGKRLFNSFPKTDTNYISVSKCVDSCYDYLRALNRLNDEKDFLRNSPNEEFFSLDREVPIPPQPQISEPQEPTASIPVPERKNVTPTSVTATFYTINIKAFGWFNIDILMKESSNCVPSELFVRMQGKYEVDYTVSLIIPSVKAFVQGGKLEDGKMYGFDETDGKINLPQQAPCYIIAFAEVDGKLIFGKAEFNATTKQTIDLSFTETTKEGLANEIKALKLDGVDAEVKDSKNAELINIIKKEETATEKIRPKNCDCGLEGEKRLEALRLFSKK